MPTFPFMLSQASKQMILLIEDDQHKCKRVLECVIEICEKLDIESDIQTRHSYNSGLRACLSLNPSFVILDMTMPTFDRTNREQGGRVRPFAGIDLLSELKRRKIFIPVVILTGFDVIGEGQERRTRDELTVQIAKSYGKQFLGTIFYSPRDLDWKEDLQNALGRIGERAGE